ncbi:hypothetical protein GQ457_09G020820 [Hibiscus cannabinus]
MEFRGIVEYPMFHLVCVNATFIDIGIFAREWLPIGGQEDLSMVWCGRKAMALFFQWWMVEVVQPTLLVDFLGSCLHSCFVGTILRWWLVGRAVVLWSMWLARNDLLFNDKAIWWKCSWLCEVLLHTRMAQVGVSWCPPPIRVLKFNIDSSAKGKSGLTGCGGVLRDERGIF